ncbi:hypothetical protein GlitD10_2512 [Gloeomargarita lithophora Alchichica-D10]|uniref:Uncharacterized protein n=1 Tax=Gloeomargarita lithophora Alchichica-D10 TaxID=1188229 RepID=A0A1J0AFY3_9CYAN|nr:hypothetical protein [Gloeomargarita lithophora]APB34849.1 hypothetical protein GlitD10_2512 [Gloeomargarita lithophora Alchichica-D10]
MSAHILWFRRNARQLQVLGTKFELDHLPQVKDLVKFRMGDAWRRMQNRGSDLNDPLVWWEQLRIHGILELETSGGTPERVAVWLETVESRAYGTLEQVKREPFATMRSELEIQRHWVFWVPREPVAAEVWCDLFYSHIDQKANFQMIPIPVAVS